MIPLFLLTILTVAAEPWCYTDGVNLLSSFYLVVYCVVPNVLRKFTVVDGLIDKI